ncbi:hypothetical protein SDC9_138190 [bioreactor metagenome]|uniref:Uncharacterized protein n=1 Tax=bioreactor metagenome TaxID=1076179 RepID=A0A645DP93_9ZZZZ
MGAARGAVAADAEQEIDVHAHQGVDHHDGVLLPARGTEDGAALFMDIVGVLFGQQDGREFVGRVEAAAAVADAVDERHFVLPAQRAGQELDDVVQPGAKPARGQDRRLAPGGIVINLLTRPGLFEGRNLLAVFEVFRQFHGIAVVGDRRIVVDERDGRVERRVKLRPAEARNLKIVDIHRSVKLLWKCTEPTPGTIR